MKIEIFREMHELNEGFERVIASLKRLEKCSLLCRELVQESRAEAVVLQLEANQFFFDRFERLVGDDARWAYKFLNDSRERLKDPEDIYLDVKKRETLRSEKGLPPRVRFLPDWDRGDEQRYDLQQMVKKKGLAKRPRKKTVRRNSKTISASMPAQPQTLAVSPVVPEAENES